MTDQLKQLSEAATISADDLNLLLAANTREGKLYWKTRPASMFKTQGYADAWNKRHAGNRAEWNSGGGYVSVTIFQRRFPVHRVIWAMHYGEWPNSILDHLNGNGSDNRISNLRLASRSDNSKNAAMRNDNTSGHTGVYWDRAQKKWCAEYWTGGRKVFVGRFNILAEAVCAREKAVDGQGFTKRHGLKNSPTPDTQENSDGST